MSKTCSIFLLTLVLIASVLANVSAKSLKTERRNKLHSIYTGCRHFAVSGGKISARCMGKTAYFDFYNLLGFNKKNGSFKRRDGPKKFNEPIKRRCGFINPNASAKKDWQKRALNCKINGGHAAKNAELECQCETKKGKKVTPFASKIKLADLLKLKMSSKPLVFNKSFK